MTHQKCVSKYALDGVIPAVVYKQIVKRLVYQFKYKPNLHSLDKTIAHLMTEGLSQNESLYGYIERYKPTVIPIPLSAKRLKERGYNHAELLTSYVAQYFSLKINTKLLVRIKETKPQYKLGRTARLANLSGAFAINSNISTRPTPTPKSVPSAVILIDDLATTFATLKEAAKVLKHAGVKKVVGVTFARES